MDFYIQLWYTDLQITPERKNTYDSFQIPFFIPYPAFPNRILPVIFTVYFHAVIFDPL